MLKRLLNTTSLKANIIANFGGNAYTALVSLVFVPYYLNYIGAEGYGLIGIFAGMQVVLLLLDGGLSTTLNREIARLTALENTDIRVRNLVKSLGTVYWGIAVLAGVIAMSLSPLMAKYWIHSKGLDPQTITYSFLLLSISLLFQFPTGFYGGGLLGLQRQVVLNIMKIVFATLKSVGALIILIFVSRSILAFFAWIALISLVQAFSFKYMLWHFLPKTNTIAVFDRQELKKIFHFAASLTGIGVTSVLLTQVDTVILSKILPLDKFGYYSLAFTIASVSYALTGPISQSYFPKFSALAAQKEEERLKKLYHQGCQFVTLLVIPFSLFLALFSKEVLFLWTKNAVTTQNTGAMVSVIVLAVGIHCLMFIPYMLCLAFSYTKLALYTNITILILLIPCTIFAAIHYGGLGGAFCWLLINTIYLSLNPLLIHKKLLRGEVSRWYWNDTFIAVFASGTVLLIFKYVFGLLALNSAGVFLFLALAGIAGFIAALYFLKEMRTGLLKEIKKFQKGFYGK